MLTMGWAFNPLPVIYLLAKAAFLVLGILCFIKYLKK